MYILMLEWSEHDWSEDVKKARRKRASLSYIFVVCIGRAHGCTMGWEPKNNLQFQASKVGLLKYQNKPVKAGVCEEGLIYEEFFWYLCDCEVLSHCILQESIGQ